MDYLNFMKNLENRDSIESSNIVEVIQPECEREEECMDVPTETKKKGSECNNEQVLTDYTSEYTTCDTFNTKEDVINWARDVGKRNGHVIAVKTSDVRGIHRKPRVLLACERYGSYTSKVTTETRDVKKRCRSGTKKCACPFSLKCEIELSGHGWILSVINGNHNHSPVENFEGHSFVGRLTQEEKNVLVDMSKKLVQPKDILITLKNRDPLNATTIKTIYNARSKYRIIEKSERSEMQHLLGNLREHKYFEHHRTCSNGSNVVADLIYAHPTSMDLLRTFPRVLLLDCTYKTNKYCFPLLEIVGITSTKMKFSVAFAYLGSEQENNFLWVLQKFREILDDNGCDIPSIIITDMNLSLMNATEKVFPVAQHLLCKWHISKNVLIKSKKIFKEKKMWEDFMNCWGSIVAAGTVTDYEKKLLELTRDFRAYPNAVSYVMNSWLTPYKEKFVEVWTNTYMHFGNVTTNRVENTHAKLKRQLGSPQCSFQVSWTKIHALLELEVGEIKASFERSMSVVQHSYIRPLFRDIRGLVSTAALEEIAEELKRVVEVGNVKLLCGGCYKRATHGISCMCELAEFIRDDVPIPLTALHPHWARLKIVPRTTSLVPDFIPLMYKYVDEIATYDSSQWSYYAKKMREVFDPQTTDLCEPNVKTNTRGKRRHGATWRPGSETCRGPNEA